MHIEITASNVISLVRELVLIASGSFMSFQIIEAMKRVDYLVNKSSCLDDRIFKAEYRIQDFERLLKDNQTHPENIFE
jgi:hypothetical protein